jgi:hypothetical protein
MLEYVNEAEGPDAERHCRCFTFQDTLQEVEWNIFEPKWHLFVLKVVIKANLWTPSSASYFHLPHLARLPSSYIAFS